MGGTLSTSWEDALGAKHADQPIALYENGRIYAATDGFLGTTAKGTLIGEYEAGMVYAVHGTRRTATVAEIENGRIYWLTGNVLGGATRSLIGECSCGHVYSRSKEHYGVNGVYSGDDEGAAAAAAIALFKLEPDMSAYFGEKMTKEKMESSNENKSSYSSDDDSGKGISCFVTIILGIIVFALSVVALIISSVSFLATWLTYLLVKFIIKQCRKNVNESAEQKKKE